MSVTLPLTFYQQEVNRIKANFFSKEYLYAHAKAAKKYIDENYGSKIDLDAIAAKAFCSKFHFIRLFSNLYGQTPYQYLTAVRIKKAKQFLLSGNSVAQTSLLVGFESATSFTGSFKKYTGYAPAAFVKYHSRKLATA